MTTRDVLDEGEFSVEGRQGLVQPHCAVSAGAVWVLKADGHPGYASRGHRAAELHVQRLAGDRHVKDHLSQLGGRSVHRQYEGC